MFNFVNGRNHQSNYTTYVNAFRNPIGTILGHFLTNARLTALQAKVESASEFLAKQAV
jgi:uncharacterized protein (DUF39 family)